MSAQRFRVVYSLDYAKQYPESEVAECEAEGAEPCYLCIDTTDGRVLGRDGGEPKDQMLIRGWRWVARELNMLDAKRDESRDALRALVEAMDAQVAASLQGDDRTEADAAFARALKAARGVL